MARIPLLRGCCWFCCYFDDDIVDFAATTVVVDATAEYDVMVYATAGSFDVAATATAVVSGSDSGSGSAVDSLVASAKDVVVIVGADFDDVVSIGLVDIDVTVDILS